MASRSAWLLVPLAGIIGCVDGPDYYWRHPCEEGINCCPAGSHETVDSINPAFIACTPDEKPCPDAGLDAGACQEAGTDAY